MTGSPVHLFAGRQLCIATMHRKELVLAPCLEAALGVQTCLPAGFDSDRFGTFAGDVPRLADARATARAKAEAAMRLAGVDLAVASEGTFLPHPAAPIVPAGLELVLLVDLRHGFEVAGEDFTTVTNHAKERCMDLSQALAFGAHVGFPEHGLLLSVGEPPRRVWRDIHDPDVLARAVREARDESARLDLPWFVASDMRAHHNPTRMQSIARACAALVARTKTCCPACARPGFGEIGVERGLPCADCGAPTTLVREHILGCVVCPERAVRPRSDGLTHAEPGQCAWCNP